MARNGSDRAKRLLITLKNAHQRRSLRALLEGEYVVHDSAELAGDFDVEELARAEVLLIGWSNEAKTRQLVARVRRADETRNLGIVLLAAEDNFADAVSLLSFGADDCVRLPVDGIELLARVDACYLRRFGVDGRERIAAGPILLDKRAHQVLVNDEPVELAPTEFRLMCFLIENPGKVFSRDELLRGAWPAHITAGPRTVDVHVRRLRQLLEPYNCDTMIQTVRSFGYRFSESGRFVATRA
jgi:two-component system phosphate regulon response regulator PhoB